jgi:biotin carboxyl carrier protein
MKRYNITVNGVAYDVAVEETDGAAPIAAVPAAPVAAPAAASAPAPAAAPAAAPVAAGGTQVKAPMSGTILDVKVSAGQAVKKGQALFVLEAMKMENDIVAPADGTVASVNTSKGESVATDAVLAVIS